MSELENNRGGRRAGAGRKARGKHGPKVLSVTVRVSRDTKEKLSFIKARGWKIAQLVEAKVNDVYDMINNGMFNT